MPEEMTAQQVAAAQKIEDERKQHFMKQQQQHQQQMAAAAAGMKQEHGPMGVPQHNFAGHAGARRRWVASACLGCMLLALPVLWR
jgi:fructosamine-3-kinase